MTVTDWITITLAVAGIILGIRLFFLDPELKADAEGKGETADKFLRPGTRLPTSDGEHATGSGESPDKAPGYLGPPVSACGSTR